MTPNKSNKLSGMMIKILKQIVEQLIKTNNQIVS